jgi:dTDP-4-dehydrorhamnose 3,5-epimerase
MNVIEKELPGVCVIEPDVYADERGDFRELWNARDYAEHGLEMEFVQDNLSRSQPHVLRGLHFQNPNPQGKLVTVLRGEVYDVIVDIRLGAPTFGEWEGVTLSRENGRQLYVPGGFAHGFVVTGDTRVLFHYKCTEFYDPEAEGSIRWDDSGLGIDWPVEDPILSVKDRSAPLLEELPEEQVRFGGVSSRRR